MQEEEPRFQVTDYVDVRARARELGCEEPGDLTLLPRNFESAESRADLVHEASAPTVRVLFRQADIAETPLEGPEGQLPTLHENNFNWIGPTLFISAALLSQDPNAVAVALNLISNYVHDWFKGTFGSRRVMLGVVVENPDGGSRRITYNGPEDGLAELPRILREATRHGD